MLHMLLNAVAGHGWISLTVSPCIKKMKRQIRVWLVRLRLDGLTSAGLPLQSSVQVETVMHHMPCN